MKKNVNKEEVKMPVWAQILLGVGCALLAVFTFVAVVI